MLKKLRRFFCKHAYSVVCWRRVHYPDYEPYVMAILSRCDMCGKNKIWYLRSPELQNTMKTTFSHLEDVHWNGEEDWVKKDEEN